MCVCVCVCVEGGRYFLNDSVAGFAGISHAYCCSVKDCALSSSSLPTVLYTTQLGQ